MPVDEHARIVAENDVIRTYWDKRGGPLPLEGSRGSYYYTEGMRLEALKALGVTEPVPSFEQPVPGQPLPEGIVLVEPGSGSKRVAILAPGPSLPRSWGKISNEHLAPDEPGWIVPASFYDLTIAVNNAISVHGADWWCCQDAGPLRAYEGQPQVGICTSRTHANQIKKGELDVKCSLDGLTILESGAINHHLVPRVAGWSLTNAIMLACRLGAKTIDLYGVDQEGSDYFDGAMTGRSLDTRWARERRDVEAVTAHCASVGVTVTNIRPQEKPEPGKE